MPELILNCPQCGRDLRIPEDLFGRPVKCPACGLTFAAPADATARQAVGSNQQDLDSTEDDYHARLQPPDVATWATEETVRDRARAVITPPAVVLLLSGILGLLTNAGRAIYFAARMHLPAQAPAQAPRNFLEELQQQLGQEANGPVPIVLGIVFAIDSLLVILAAFQMLRLRTYAFAIVGTVLAMINLGNLCCLLGLPAGIWALVTLSRPDVRSAFQ